MIYAPWITQDWPKFPSHREARCFNCGGPLESKPRPIATNPPGVGHHQGHCARCRMYTWYDLSEPESPDDND